MAHRAGWPYLRAVGIDVAYLLAAALALPCLIAWRCWRRKPTIAPWRRLGRGAPFDTPLIWIHAVSVGETLAARGLIEGILASRSDLTVLLTVTTASGLEVAHRALAGPRVRVEPAPLDLSCAIGRVLRRARPCALLLMELELWPNTLGLCERAGVPVLIANARLSERSLRGYRRLRRVWPGFPPGVAAVLAQDRAHAERFRSLGVPAERVHVVGNLKFDNASLRDLEPLRSRLRAEHGYSASQPILVAASTHPGEEALVLDAFASLRGDSEPWRLVLVPRHPERVAAVSEQVAALGGRWGKRSWPGMPSDPEVLLVDTMGELADLYALGDVAFVGGTLVPVGGHNLLEPASFGLPLVVGPHLDTVRSTAEALLEVGALTVARTSSQLAAAVRATRTGSARDAAGRGAARLIESERGSRDRTLGILFAAAKI